MIKKETQNAETGTHKHNLRRRARLKSRAFHCFGRSGKGAEKMGSIKCNTSSISPHREGPPAPVPAVLDSKERSIKRECSFLFFFSSLFIFPSFQMTSCPGSNIPVLEGSAGRYSSLLSYHGRNPAYKRTDKGAESEELKINNPMNFVTSLIYALP